MPLPAAMALVRGQAIENRLIGRVLQIEIERGVDLEACGMDFFRAEAAFQLAAHFFDEPRRYRVGRSFEMQPQRRGAGGLSLGRCDLAVFEHGIDDDVPPAKGAVRVQDRRELKRAFGQPRKQRGFRKREVAGVFREVVFRAGLKAVDAAA